MAERIKVDLKELAKSGEIDSFLLHLAGSELSVRDINDLLGEASECAATRKEKQSKIVKESAVGVENLVPNAGGVEGRQAEDLHKLAKKFKASRAMSR